MHCTESVKNGKRKLHSPLWGQCTLIVKNECKASDDHGDIKNKEDLICLIKSIKSVTDNFRDKNVWLAMCGVSTNNHMIAFKKKMKMLKTP